MNVPSNGGVNDTFTLQVPGPLAPHIACPTTSGTGSEVTGWATVWNRAVEPSRADAAEGEYVAWGELDCPGLVERAIIRQDEARDEQRFLALARRRGRHLIAVDGQNVPVSISAAL